MTTHAETRRGRPLGFDPYTALDELMYLFWDKGYDHTAQADMVERTGLSSSSLYNAFGDKAAIFDAVLTRYNEGVDANCAPMFDRADGLEALEAFIDRLAHTSRSRSMDHLDAQSSLRCRRPEGRPRPSTRRSITTARISRRQ